MLFLWFLALVTTGASLNMSFQKVRRHSHRNWSYWGALLVYPSHAVLCWVWLSWVIGDKFSHKDAHLTLLQWAVVPVITLTGDRLKRWHQSFLARLAYQNANKSDRVL